MLNLVRSAAVGSRSGGLSSHIGPAIGLGPPPFAMRFSRPKVANEPADCVRNTHGTSGATWVVTESMLRPLPEDYDVARTSRYVIGSKLGDISMRIACVFKISSIMSSYDSKKAKATCTSPDFVKFQVRLHSGRGTYSDGIIVEIQRRRGSSMSFLKLCSLILNAAEGSLDVNRDACFSSLTKKPPSSMACLRGADKSFESPLSLSFKGLTEAEKLLNNKCLDVNELGMQYLCKLLDNDSTCLKVCMKAFSAVVHGTNYPVLHEKVLFHLTCHGDDALSSTSKMRSMAFEAIYRGLKLRVDNPCPDSILALDPTLVISPWLLEAFIPLIISVMKGGSSPREMGWAVRSLELLVVHSERAKGRMIECGGEMELFERSKEIGEAHCSCLEDYSERILKALR